MTRGALLTLLALTACLRTPYKPPEEATTDDTTADEVERTPTEWADATPASFPEGCRATLLMAEGTATTAADTLSADVVLDVPDGVRSIQVITDTPGKSSVALGIDGPDGPELVPDNWWGNDEVLTLGVYWIEDRPVRGYTWPIVQEAGFMTEGEWTWRMGVSSTASTLEGEVEFGWKAYAVQDNDPDQGCLFAHAVLAENVDDGDHVETGVRAAVDEWVRIYGEYGIDVFVRWGTTDGLAEHDGNPSAEIAALTALRDPHEITVLLNETVGGDASTRLGRAQLGGPLAPGSNSEVVVGWKLHANGDPDGTADTFESHEITFMGQTIAHEVGHYMGLPHPAEMDGTGTATTWDALDDTPACVDTDDCTTELGENLMFPWSWCWANPDDCDAAETLTAEQVGVLQNFPGTL